MMQTRLNASRATSIDQTRVIQDELNRIEARTTTSIKALSKEMADLRAWISDAHNDKQRSAIIDKESVDGGLRETRKDLRNLRKYLEQVELLSILLSDSLVQS